MKSKKLTKLMKIQAVVFAAVFAAGACSVGAFAYNCSRVRSDVLRMHVIANSDCSADQQLKLMVRDAVLERGAQLFDGTVTADEARRKIEPHKAELEAAAREVIERAGYDYPVSVNVVNEYFATRCYGSLTMPARALYRSQGGHRRGRGAQLVVRDVPAAVPARRAGQGRQSRRVF